MVSKRCDSARVRIVCGVGGVSRHWMRVPCDGTKTNGLTVWPMTYCKNKKPLCGPQHNISNGSIQKKCDQQLNVCKIKPKLYFENKDTSIFYFSQ